MLFTPARRLLFIRPEHSRLAEYPVLATASVPPNPPRLPFPDPYFPAPPPVPKALGMAEPTKGNLSGIGAQTILKAGSLEATTRVEARARSEYGGTSPTKLSRTRGPASFVVLREDVWRKRRTSPFTAGSGEVRGFLVYFFLPTTEQRYTSSDATRVISGSGPAAAPKISSSEKN
jgi:hypothetical protein